MFRVGSPFKVQEEQGVLKVQRETVMKVFLEFPVPTITRDSIHKIEKKTFYPNSQHQKTHSLLLFRKRFRGAETPVKRAYKFAKRLFPAGKFLKTDGGIP